jgi:hypothetical protein
MKKIFPVLIVIVLFFFAMKSCIKTTAHFKDYILLELIDTTQVNLALISPDNELVIMKMDQSSAEYGIYKIRGEEATHYLGGLYNLGENYFSIRYYSGAQKVYNTTLELTHRVGDSFPRVGEKFNARIIIYKSKIKIGNFDYMIRPLNEEEKSELIKIIVQIKNK